MSVSRWARSPGTPIAGIVRLLLFSISSGLLFGVDLGSIGGGMQGMREELHFGNLMEESIVAGAKGGAIFGCLLGGAWMAVYGRKRAVVFSVVPFFLGPALIGLAQAPWQALVGRLVNGFGVGVASVAAPCYLSEAAQPSVRGIIVACYEVAIAFGFLVSSVLAYVIEEAESTPGSQWRYQVGFVPFVATFPLLLSMGVVPESPRWLLMRRRCDEEILKKALVGMRKLRIDGAEERLKAFTTRAEGSAGEEAVTWGETTNDLMELWDRRYEEFSASNEDSPRPDKEPRPSVRRILRGTFVDVFKVACGAHGVPPGARRGLLLAVAAAILDQVCASTSVLVYAQRLMRSAGVISPSVQDSMAIAVASSKFVGVFAGLAIVDRIGRRHLLGIGGACSAVTLTVAAFGAANQAVLPLLLGLSIFILIFVATWGNGYWVVVTEVTAAGGRRYISSMQAAATAMLFVAGWFTSFTFVSVMEAGPWAMLIYAGVGVFMCLYGYCLLPETRGLSLEECAELLSGHKQVVSSCSMSTSSSDESSAEAAEVHGDSSEVRE